MEVTVLPSGNDTMKDFHCDVHSANKKMHVLIESGAFVVRPVKPQVQDLRILIVRSFEFAVLVLEKYIKRPILIVDKNV